MIKRIAHVGIATRSIGVTAEFYQSLGLEVSTIEVVKDEKVKVAVMEVGDSAIELIEATEDNSPTQRFIEERGEGIHHITFEVDDLEKQLEILRERNIKLIDEKPRQGAQGCLIAFIHPDSTGGVLIELSQPAPEGSS
ncbi:methylmalonyl-CoA epimerase [Acidobacteria bacterium AH-259-D05]|nr:methylmalonyl-CoA epimerase [Acidobacteria bacterium AH-259-D05]